MNKAQTVYNYCIQANKIGKNTTHFKALEQIFGVSKLKDMIEMSEHFLRISEEVMESIDNESKRDLYLERIHNYLVRHLEITCFDRGFDIGTGFVIHSQFVGFLETLTFDHQADDDKAQKIIRLIVKHIESEEVLKAAFGDAQLLLSFYKWGGVNAIIGHLSKGLIRLYYAIKSQPKSQSVVQKVRRIFGYIDELQKIDGQVSFIKDKALLLIDFFSGMG